MSSQTCRLARWGGLALVVFALGVAQRAAAVDIKPTSHVLVPYFEVVLDIDCRNTHIAVANSANKPVDVTATVHSNWGIKLLSVPYRIPADGVWRFDLRTWILEGRLPDGRQLSPAQLAHLQAALSGRASPTTGLYYGTDRSPAEHTVAVGYVRVATRPRKHADVLWGDYEISCPQSVMMQGETLVDVDPVDPEDQLCRSHAVRFLVPRGGDTELLVWTPVSLEPSRTPQPTGVVPTRLLWFDDAGKVFRQELRDLLPVEMLVFPEGSLEREFGWVAIAGHREAFVTGHYTQDTELSSSLHAWCLPAQALPDEPAITLEKRVEGQDADQPTGPVMAVGSTLHWTFVVTNVGAADLVDVLVADDSGLVVFCPATTLAVGESMTCTATSTAVACQHRNQATASARTGDGIAVSATDVAHYFGDQEASLVLATRVQGQDADTPTGPHVATAAALAFTYQVTNTGEVTISGIAVTDSKALAVTCPKLVLAPGESMTCTASATAAAGQQRHVGTASGADPCERVVSATDPAHYFGDPAPEPADISLEKLVNGDDADTPPGPTVPLGSTLAWSFVVTNTGTVQLTTVALTDEGKPVACPKTALAPGESMTCTATSIASRAGQFVNVAHVSGQPVPSGALVEDDDPAHYRVLASGQGCSPGYWKNHPASWPPTGYSTATKVVSVFSGASRSPALANSTLLQALAFGGGSGEAGAAETLLRAAVAALLDASHPSVAYPRTPAAVVSDVNLALAGSRDAMLTLAAALDADNNLGCPLS